MGRIDKSILQIDTHRDEDSDVVLKEDDTSSKESDVVNEQTRNLFSKIARKIQTKCEPFKQRMNTLNNA